MTTPDVLEAALAAEFGGSVLFVPAPPATYAPPQIVVVPDDPFHAPGTQGTIEERWRVTVVTSFKEGRSGFASLRELSHRLRAAVQGAGGIWEQTRGPTSPGQTSGQTVLAEGAIRFKYPPPT